VDGSRRDTVDIEDWAPSSAAQPCPCCGATHGCRTATAQAFVLCRTVASAWPAAGGGWFHRLLALEGGWVGSAPRAADRHLVLVVDDDAAIRGLAAAVLEDEPALRTAQAVDGADALDMLARERPSVVLLDLAMPRVDGFEVCRRLKADPATRSIPVVAMSAGGRRQAALDAGADDFVGKPFGIDDLAAAVHRWVAVG
jgi:CheY-like chemotaxis protein